jgi:hypothetical protein
MALFDQITGHRLDEGFLADLEGKDNIFPAMEGISIIGGWRLRATA